MLTHTMLYLLMLNDDKDAVMNVDKAKKRIAKLVKKGIKGYRQNYAQFNYWRKKLLASAPDSRPAGFTRVTQLATSSAQDGLALHLPGGMRLSGITAGNLDVAVAILRQL